MYKEYIELVPHGEKYEMKPPGIGIHNLIIGKPYLEPKGKAYLYNCACPKEMYAEIEFPSRGWSKDSYFRVSGNVYTKPGNITYKIEGKWSESVYLIDLSTGTKECVWTK